MQLAILLLVVFIGVVLAVRFFLPSAGPPDNRRARERRAEFTIGNPFHAVSIQPAEICCAQVQAIDVTRFLSDDAPGLPLPDCDTDNCRCKYVHHADRRDGARDRRHGEALAPEAVEFWSLRNRRGAPGRRTTDLQLA